MKKLLLLCLMVATILNALAQNKQENNTAYPTHGIVLEKDISSAYINGSLYKEISVKLDAADYGDRNFFEQEIEGVKITIRDKKGKKIYKKRFKNALLYVFPDGKIQVGRGNRGSNVVTYLQMGKEKIVGWVMAFDEKGLDFDE